MRIYKHLLSIVAIVICATQLSAQVDYNSKFSEIGIGIGTFQYQGDLTANLPILEQFTYAGTIFYRHNFNSAFAAKLQLSYGKISGDDLNAARFNARNTSFRSTIAEVSLIGQINIIPLINKDYSLGQITPYFFAGISGFYFNPQGKFQGEWYDLQPLGTEGQGLAEYPDKDPYSLYQISIPFGIDIRYNLSRRVFTGFELGMRKTFTDYLDDVSGTYADNQLIANTNGDIASYFADPSGLNFPEGKERGNARKKDWYSFFSVYFTYNLIGKRDWRYIKKRAF